MSTKKTQLAKAVEKQASNLDPAQREFVMAEFQLYEWNAEKIAKIEEQVESGELDTDEEAKKLRTRHQLVGEQSSLFGHMMKWLNGTAVEESDFDRFLAGQ